MTTNQTQINRPSLFRWLMIIICLFLSNKNTSAQNISFNRLGLKEGLSEIAGLCIQQDPFNRIWIGTRNGLNCWDGVRMKTYYPQRGDTASLLEHKISQLCLSGNYLWARSNKGVSQLDLNRMSFRRFHIEGIECIESFNTQVIVGTQKGLLVFNEERSQFEKSQKLFNKDIAINSIHQSTIDQSLWLASDETRQIIRVTPEKTDFIQVPVENNFMVYDLYTDSRNRLWIATRYHGILIYTPETNAFSFINKESKPYHLEDLSVRSLTEDNEGRLWAGTFKGLAIFDINKETTTFIHASENDEHSLSHNSVYNLFYSSDGNMWIGTYFGGVNYGRISNQVFTEYNKTALGEKPSHSVIGELLEDKLGNIWIATEGAGVDYFNRGKNTFTNYPSTNDHTGLSQTNVKSLFLTSDDKLLIGTYQGGLNILDLDTRLFKRFSDPTRSNYPKHVNAIIKYGDDFLLGTELGVIRFAPDNETLKPLLANIKGSEPQSMVSTLYIDSMGILWIGYENSGLASYNPESGEYQKYLSEEFDNTKIASNSINCIMEDHRFRLWIGTDGGGLCQYNRKENRFKTFNRQQNNLPSDFVYGIKESRYGNLWIATSKGLSRFDLENKTFFNYTHESGLPLLELNYKSILLTNSGELFIGGIDGLISFREKDLLTIEENLKVNFSSLHVNNKEILANDDSGILSCDISVAKSFVLKPKHTVFSINFSSFNYNNTLNNKFQYQLVGFNEDWVNSEFNTTATYTNLNPGKYTFRVRGTDAANNPVTEEKSIDIIVKPPLSRTWYAYTFYGLVFVGLILLFNYFYLGKVRLQYQLKNERTEKERIEELNTHKLRFFTNISHEFMSPLTIILSSLEHAFEKFKIPSNLAWQLNLALRNAKRLKNLNSELLDFRKIEQGYLKLRVQENNIASYLNDIYEAFEEIAHHKGIAYKYLNTTEELAVWYDAKQMDKVFYNLLSNAMNHVPEHTGEITIQLINKPEEVVIQVIDNGSGIPKDDIHKIFDRFFQHDSKPTENTYQGSGIGLALSQSIINAHKGTIGCESEEGKGTTFTVTLRKGNSHFSAGEISSTKRANTFSMDKELILLTENVVPADNNHLTEDEAPSLLIVDDNAGIRTAISTLFADTYHIITADDGFDGLEKALKHQPDIIISDVMMPKLSGFEMCKKLKTNVNTSHIPILMLTALDSEEDHATALKNGADSYCTKPFSSEILKATVENLFRNREMIQKKYSTTPGSSTQNITKNSVDREFMKKADTIIERNLLNPEFNVDEFAAEMNLGRTIFYSKVKTITGQTPNEYIQTFRLKKAADMLANDPTKNISEVAYDTGFNSPRYFAMAFKKHFGVNPSQYIQEKK